MVMNVNCANGKNIRWRKTGDNQKLKDKHDIIKMNGMDDAKRR